MAEATVGSLLAGAYEEIAALPSATVACALQNPRGASAKREAGLAASHTSTSLLLPSPAGHSWWDADARNRVVRALRDVKRAKSALDAVREGWMTARADVVFDFVLHRLELT